MTSPVSHMQHNVNTVCSALLGNWAAAGALFALDRVLILLIFLCYYDQLCQSHAA